MLQRRRVADGVRIQNKEVISTGSSNTEIIPAAETEVVFRNDNFDIRKGVPDQVAGSIRIQTVVHHDDLDRAIGQPVRNRFQAGPDFITRLPGDNDHRETRALIPVVVHGKVSRKAVQRFTISGPLNRPRVPEADRAISSTSIWRPPRQRSVSRVARATGSCGSIKNEAWPQVSRRTGMSLQITGRPCRSASSGGRPCPSSNEG